MTTTPHESSILTLQDLQEPDARVSIPAFTDDDEPDPEACSNPGGHEWDFTGTSYGGDDESYHGEGRSYCIHCGADGDA